MNNAALNRNKAVVMEKMAAFSLYLDEGMAAVERMYPQHIAFVQHHLDKTMAEVKKEVLHAQAA